MSVSDSEPVVAASETRVAAPDAEAVKLTVDASGLKCPLPILRAKKALSQLESGDVLAVITTDKNAVKDFQAFCRQTGNALLSQISADVSCTHLLRRR